jgi:hypothetical protein
MSAALAAPATSRLRPAVASILLMLLFMIESILL